MEKQKLDTASALELLSNSPELLSSATLVGEYLDWICSVCEEHKENKHKESYIKNIQEEEKYTGKRPFLSIVMRTQGKRISLLREVLLCLYSQSNQDFELIIVGHKVDLDNRDKIQRVIQEQEPSFRERIRYYEIDYGTRASPLNFGFSHARGLYIVNCDDDDIVLENWVSALYVKAQSSPNCLLHVYTVTQSWSAHEVGGSNAARADGYPQPAYCRDYSQFVQLHHNMCPFFSIAFPSYIFNKLNIWFDEELDTVEDWDYIMRTALLAGVADIPETLLIYRLWRNTESSHTLHNEYLWKKNEVEIIKKSDSYPVLLKPGYSAEIRAFYTNPVMYSKSFSKREMTSAGEISRVEKLKTVFKMHFRESGFIYRFCRRAYQFYKKK